MKKIVKLTESDLVTIIKKVIGEQQLNIDPRLMPQKSDYLGKGSKFEIQQTNLSKKGTKIPQGNTLPLHIYAALKFSTLQSSPLTEKDLNQNTKNTLFGILCEKSKRMKTCDPNLWGGTDPKGNKNKNYLGYLDYTTLYSKSPQYDRTLKSSSFSYDQPTQIKELMLTIGQGTVTKSGNNWIVSDVYNFDNILKSKPWLKYQSLTGINLVSGLSIALWDIIRGKSPVSGMEQILSQFHNFGYKGFKTKIVVPIGNCPCNKLSKK